MARPNLLSPGLVLPGGELSKQLADYLESLANSATVTGVAESIADLQAQLDALDVPAFNINGTPHQITLLGDLTTGLAISIAVDYPGQVSIATVGTITVGTWNGAVIGPTFGGTGLATYATGDVLYASAPDVLSALPAGANGDVLTLDAGVPTWAAPSGAGGFVPTFIASGDTFTVPANSQALFAYPIDVEGFLAVDGVLIEVS